MDSAFACLAQFTFVLTFVLTFVHIGFVHNKICKTAENWSSGSSEWSAWKRSHKEYFLKAWLLVPKKKIATHIWHLNIISTLSVVPKYSVTSSPEDKESLIWSNMDVFFYHCIVCLFVSFWLNHCRPWIFSDSIWPSSCASRFHSLYFSRFIFYI